MELKDRLDWVAKKWMLEMFVQSEGVDWNDPWLQSLDLEYHNIDPNRGFYLDLEHKGMTHRILTEEQIARAGDEPPADTRARGRSDVIRALSENRMRYIVDWDSVYLENESHLSLQDPFETYRDAAAEFIREIRSAAPSPRRPMRRRLK